MPRNSWQRTVDNWRYSVSTSSGSTSTGSTSIRVVSVVSSMLLSPSTISMTTSSSSTGFGGRYWPAASMTIRKTPLTASPMSTPSVGSNLGLMNRPAMHSKKPAAPAKNAASGRMTSRGNANNWSPSPMAPGLFRSSHGSRGGSYRGHGIVLVHDVWCIGLRFANLGKKSRFINR